MSIHAVCSAISSSLSHNLRLSRSIEDRHSFASQALDHAGKTVLPMLERLRVEKGEDSEAFRRARESVVELVSFICIPYVRNCTSYSAAVANLEQQITDCRDALVKKKMVTYANQMKAKWNQAEAGGIIHAPRAKRRTILEDSKDSMLTGGILLVALCLVVFLLMFNRSTDPQNPPSKPASFSDHTEQQPTSSPAREPAVALQDPAASGSFYRYTDEQGVLHLVNDLAKVPERHRMAMEVIPAAPAASGGDVTVTTHGDRVVVPVKLRYQGRETEARLLLDTGATITTINEAVASRLGVTSDVVKARPAKVADGRSVTSYVFAADSVSVGSKSQLGTGLAILPGSGGDGTEGLLGMNFLKQYRYHVDFKRGVLQLDQM